MSTLFGILLYNAPWLIALYRKQKGLPMAAPFGTIFLMSFFLGWTIVGWLIPLAAALNLNVVAPVAIWLAKFLGNSGLAGNPGASAGGSGPGICFTCHGSGTVTKAAYEMSAMDAQNTMNQQNQMSRQVPCSTCGGSGRTS